MKEALRVRYYECDMQGVVHNAVYLAWCDDVGDRLFRDAGLGGDDSWDVMVRSAAVSWESPARLGDEIEIEAMVTRWGTSSFAVTYTGAREDVRIFEAAVTYVAVDMAGGTSVPVPEPFRRQLST